MQAGAERGRSFERINHRHVSFRRRTYKHAHAEVVAGLPLAQQRVRFRIEEVGVRIEGAKHGGNRAAVNQMVGIHFIGKVRFYSFVDLRKLLDACVHVGFRLSRKVGVDRAVDYSQEGEPQAPAESWHFCKNL